jgi:protein tyrosine phosphatase (PTP) superfamily phosphohydrolase (DUF442 family)
MRASISKSLRRQRLSSRIVLSILTLVILSVAPATFAQSGREQVEGVKNFGRVTERYFRGGAITPTGIESLAAMGVRTIIDLRDNPNADEPAVSRRNGIKYFNFPMTGHDTPDDKAVSAILSIIQNAKEPVYVHCSAGKHRAGSIAALYRHHSQNRAHRKTDFANGYALVRRLDDASAPARSARRGAGDDLRRRREAVPGRY